MAYSEQTASTPDDVINKIATFASANGWTIDSNTLAGSNRTLTLRNTTDYIHVYNSDATNVRVRASVGYTPGQPPANHPNPSGEALANLGAGPYTKLYMFANASPSPHIHVVVELTGGIFRFLSFGMVSKLGTWTGGTYVDASYWNESQTWRYYWMRYHSSLFDSMSDVAYRGSIRCDIPLDGRANAWASLGYNAAYRAYTGLFGGDSNTGTGYLTTQFYNRNSPPFSGQVALGTIEFDIFRIGGFWSPSGSFPNVRYLNMERFNPGQEITVGADVWKVFPMCRKGGGTYEGNADYSNNHAYAFRKTT